MQELCVFLTVSDVINDIHFVKNLFTKNKGRDDTRVELFRSYVHLQYTTSCVSM